VLIRPILKKTPYELFKGRRHVLSHLKVFRCKCFILNNGKESLGKFEAKADEGVMSSNFCPHLIFKFGDLIDFSVLKD